MKYLVNLDLNQNEIQNFKIQNLATAPAAPVAGQVYFNTGSNKYFGYNGSAWVDISNVYTHPASHSISQVSGLQTALDEKSNTHNHPYRPDSWVPTFDQVTEKPATYTPSAHTHADYVNQSAFTHVKVGSTTVSADNATDTLEFVAGSNITITPDAATDKVTIAANVPAHPAGEHVTSTEKSNWNAKETTSGAQTKADNAKTSAIASAKTYTDTKVSALVGSAPETLDTLQELASAIEGNQAGVTDLLTQVGKKADTIYVNTELAKKSNSDHTHSYAPSSHNHNAFQVTAMTGYLKPDATSAIAVADTLNVAVGKLEKALDGKQAAGSYATSNHNHDSDYLGKTATATAATKLATARTINGVAFDGTTNITVADSTKVAPTGTIVAERIAIFNDTTGKVIKDSGYTIATSVPSGAKFTDTVYTHPSTHPASVIVQDANNRFVTDSQKSAWDGKAAGNHNHNGVYTRKYAANIGNGTLTTIRVAHNLGSEDVTILVKEIASKQVVMVDIQIVDINNIDILFASAPASNAYRVVVTG